MGCDCLKTVVSSSSELSKSPMKLSSLIPCIFTAAAVMLTPASNAADVVLSADSALPFESGVSEGFSVRTVQGPLEPLLANNLTRALRQLNGTHSAIQRISRFPTKLPLARAQAAFTRLWP